MLEQALIKIYFRRIIFFFTELPAQVKHYDIKSLLVPGIKNNHYCVKRSLQCYKRMQIVVEGSQRANDRGFLEGLDGCNNAGWRSSKGKPNVF